MASKDPNEALELKPCPHCGGKAEFIPVVPPTIRCTKCSGEFVVGISSLHSMTARVWNMRTEECVTEQKQKS